MSEPLDWGEGNYEDFSPSLVPAAARLLEIAAPRTGERAIDLGCGDGNATLPLAQAGATVTAIDPSLRLVGVAGQRAAAAGFHIATVHAPAERLPLPDGDADLIVSNFAVIFSDEPEQAAREVLRVLAPGGRFVYTAWCPSGPFAEASAVLRGAAAEGGSPITRGVPNTDEPAGDEPTAEPPCWDEPAFLHPLVPGGADAITIYPEALDFIAADAADYVDRLTDLQPAWRAARRSVADDRWPTVREQLITAFAAASIEPGRLVLRSPYVVVEVRPRD